MNDEVKAQAIAFLKKLSLKQLVIGGYLLIAILFTVYHSTLGDMAFKGAAYNFGRCLFWPAMLFPGLNSAITALIILGVGALVFFFN